MCYKFSRCSRVSMGLVALAGAGWLASAQEPIVIEVVPQAGEGVQTIELPGGGQLTVETRRGDPADPVEAETAADAAPVWLGLVVEPVHPALAHHLDLDAGIGVQVLAVEPGSPAENAGFERFDILTSLDDQKLFNPDQLVRLVQTYRPGDQVAVRLMRQGKAQTYRVTLSRVPEDFRPSLPRGPRPGMQPPGGVFPPNPGAMMPELQHMQRRMDEMMRQFEAMPGGPGRAAVPGFPGLQLNIDPASMVPGAETVQTATRTAVIQNERGTFKFTETDGEQHFEIKDPQGNVVFDGPVDTEEQVDQVPPQFQDVLKSMRSGRMNKFHIEVQPGGPRPVPGPGASGPTI